MHNEWTNRLRIYRRLVTNHLHDKAVELYLNTSRGITSCKLIAFMAPIIPSITCVSKFYCDVITKSHLQLIDNLIDSFLSKLHVF